MRVLHLLIIFVVLACVGYVAFSLLQGGSRTTLAAKVLGPGNTPQLCAARAIPNFTTISARLDQLADYLQENDNTTEVVFHRAVTGEIDVWAEAPDDGILDLSESEKSELLELFSGLENSNYVNGVFRKIDDRFVAYSDLVCGYSLLDWVTVRTKIPFSLHDTSQSFGAMAFIRRDDGVPSELYCDNPAKIEGDFVACEFAMNDRWALSIERVPFRTVGD